jgi:hypothetical protein
MLSVIIALPPLLLVCEKAIDKLDFPKRKKRATGKKTKA